MKDADFLKSEGMDWSCNIKNFFISATTSIEDNEYLHCSFKKGKNDSDTILLYIIASSDKFMRRDKKYHFFIELVVFDQFQKQQNNRFHNFIQCQISIKLQTVFSAKLYYRIHCQNLLPEPVNYRELEKHPLKKSFCQNIEEHMRKHYKQFKS